MTSPSRADGRSLLTLVSLMILIGVEVLGVTLSGGWALAGLFELGDHVGYALMALFSIFGLYLLVQLWRRAMGAEGAHD